MKKLLYTALLINAVLLTGCQVTGEKTGLYQKHAAACGYKFNIAEYPVQIEIHNVTDMVKAGRVREAGEKFRPIVEALWAEKDVPIVGACTEIPIAYAATGLPAE